jgi:hypothetical protein
MWFEGGIIGIFMFSHCFCRRWGFVSDSMTGNEWKYSWFHLVDVFRTRLKWELSIMCLAYE